MTEQLGTPNLSIVILCYRSEENVYTFIDELEKELDEGKVTDYELVLVGNYDVGVPDKTPDVVRNLAARKSRITPVIYEKEGMMGWDVIKGLEAASGEFISLIDGDGQMPPKDIVRVYEAMHDGHYEFVKTYRTKRFDSVTRKIISKIFNGMFRAIFPGIRYRDINSKPKIWTRAALNKLNLQCDGWFIDGEMILEANRLQLATKEIPTVFQENEWRGSFVNLLTVVEIILSILRYRFIYWFKS